VQGRVQQPMQEGVVAEQQYHMGTKKARGEKAATTDGASRFTWLGHATYGPCALNTESKMLLLQAGHVSS